MDDRASKCEVIGVPNSSTLLFFLQNVPSSFQNSTSNIFNEF
jgi:hypothetical protein